jgi:membrane protease YdiL (CAAX protease family)
MGAMTEESPDTLNSPEHYARAESSLTGESSPWPPEAGLQPDIFGIPTPPEKVHPRRIPHLGHAVLFIVIALVLLSLIQLAGVLVLQFSHLFAHHTFQWLFRKSATDARFSIPIQAIAYGIIALVCIPVFSVMWHKPFGEGIHWNNRTAWANFFLLVILGLAIGAFVAFVGDYLPMPKNPPITQDMMKSAAGAWLMLVFGLTAAPLLEELAFRGFLLPGFLNAFRWFSDRDIIPQAASKWIGIPVSILLTSLAFAFMHSPQVSHAWGPLLLIGLVSVVLCVVRLAMNSVMASVIVHAAYNFTLFAGVLYQTGGFRHLERLTG